VLVEDVPVTEHDNGPDSKTTALIASGAA